MSDTKKLIDRTKIFDFGEPIPKMAKRANHSNLEVNGASIPKMPVRAQSKAPASSKPSSAPKKP